VAHFLPLLSAYAARGAHVVEERMRELPRVARGARWIGSATLAASVYLAFRPFIQDERILYGVRNAWVLESEESWRELGRTLGQNLPPTSVLATNIAGKVPYESRLPTIDLLGLTDAVIARTKIESMGRGYAGHEKANVDYIAERRPTVLFISVLERAPLEVIQSANASSRMLASTTLRAYAPLLSDESFARHYSPALVFLTPSRTAPVFLRREVAEELRDARWLRVVDWQPEPSASDKNGAR
jgi:hypothetical protein